MIPFVIATVLACAGGPRPQPEGHESNPEGATVEVRPVTASELAAKLEQPSDQVQIVNFWATWCGPCIREMPVLQDVAAEHANVNLTFVNLDLPKLRTTKVVPFLEQRGLQGAEHLQLDDPDPGTAVQRAVPDWPDVVPVTLVVDRSGTPTARFHGEVRRPVLKRAVEAALDGTRDVR